jgi:hypothetical protein
VTTQWFINKELAFALGMNLAVPRVGSVLNAFFSPMIAASWNRVDNFTLPMNSTVPGAPNNMPTHFTGFGVPVAIWVGFGMCFMSLTCACILAFVVGTEPPTNKETSNQECFDEPSQECSGKYSILITAIPKIYLRK